MSTAKEGRDHTCPVMGVIFPWHSLLSESLLQGSEGLQDTEEPPVLETARKKGTEDFLEDCPIQDAVLMRNDDTLIRRWSGGKQRIRFYFKVFGQSSISSGLSCHTKHQK